MNLKILLSGRSLMEKSFHFYKTQENAVYPDRQHISGFLGQGSGRKGLPGGRRKLFRVVKMLCILITVVISRVHSYKNSSNCTILKDADYIM